MRCFDDGDNFLLSCVASALAAFCCRFPLDKSVWYIGQRNVKYPDTDLYTCISIVIEAGQISGLCQCQHRLSACDWGIWLPLSHCPT
jgi:hypothetical protein